MFRVISLIIGYLAGCFLTAEAVSRKYTGKSAFTIGSGNPGMANVMAQCGFTAGILVLAGDLAKTALACALCRFVLFPANGILAAAYAGFGVSFGHDFPFWHRFRGGKGVATTCAAIFFVQPLWALLAMTAGMFLVFLTQYLPIGAPLIPLIFTIMTWFLFHSMELSAVIMAMTVLMFCRHWKGICGALAGTEGKVNVAGLLKKKFGKYVMAGIVAGTLIILWFAVSGLHK